MELYLQIQSKAQQPNSVIQLGSPVHFLSRTSNPSIPSTGQVQLYSDNDFDGRLIMVDSTGKVIDINPLTTKGDIMTFSSSTSTTVRLPVGTDGQALVADSTLATGLKWGNVASPGGSSLLYKYASDNVEVLTTSTEPLTRLSLTTDSVPAGSYRIGVAYEWDMNLPSIAFETTIILDTNTVLETYTNIPFQTGTFRSTSEFFKTDLTAGVHVLALNMRVMDDSRSLSTRNVRMEIFKI